MRSLLRLSAAALMGLGFIVAAPAQSQAQVVQVGWYAQPTYYGYVPPPAPVYYPPRYYAPPVYVPPPVYYAPRPRFYGPPPWAYRHHYGRRW
jgi:hypothetical protein